MIKNRSIKFNYIMNIILTMSSFIFPLITYPYVSRILMPEGMGKISFASSVIQYFVMFAQLGIPTYGIRVCAKVRDDKEKLSKTVKELLIINLVTTFLSYIVFFVALISVDRMHKELPLYLILSSSIFLNTLGLEWLYKALEQYEYITKRSLIFKIISIVMMFLMVHSEGDYVIYSFITVISSSASYILNLIYAKKFVQFKNLKITKNNIVRHLKPIIVFFAMVCATSIYTHLDTIMLGVMKTDADVGYYNSAIKVRTILLSVVTSLGGVLLPRVSYYIEKHQNEEFWRIIKKSIDFVFTMALGLTVYFILFAKPSILLLSGNEFLPAVVPMQIIVPTILVCGLSNMTGIQILIPFGKENIVLLSEIIGAVVDFLINLWLIPIIGVSGAAIGTLIAELVVLFTQCVFLRNYIKRIFINVQYWKLFIAIACASFASVWVYFININTFLSLLITSVIFFGFYTGILILLKCSIAKEIWEIILNRIREILHCSNRLGGN